MTRGLNVVPYTVVQVYPRKWIHLYTEGGLFEFLTPPPHSRPPKVFEPVFLQFEILGERVGAEGAKMSFLPFLRGGFFYPMCLYSKYSEFCGEFKNV